MVFNNRLKLAMLFLTARLSVRVIEKTQNLDIPSYLR